MKRVLYIFTSGRKKRFLNRSIDDTPLEFFFGLPYLLENGYQVDMLELEDLNYDPHSILYKYLSWKNRLLSFITGLTSSSHFFSNAETVINNYDTVIAGNEYIAFGLAYLKKKKKISGEIIFFVMGMLAQVDSLSLNKNKNLFFLFARHIYKMLIHYSKAVIFIGAGELNYANKTYGQYNSRFNFLPFPVDTTFWKFCNNKRQDKNYILFIGNDKYRDYKCVVEIAKQMPDYIFVIISRNPECRALMNHKHVKLICGDWKDSILTDAQIRDYYLDAALVIIPLLETLQPSGQSVALQAMACEKTVLISKTRGFWEPEIFEHNKHLIFMDTNKADEWAAVIKKIICQKNQLQKVGSDSRALVEANNNLNKFGKYLEQIIYEG